MAIDLDRRQFMVALGGASPAWPFQAHAQQSAMPVLGFLNVESAQSYAGPLAAFLKGLGEAGYVDGRNVTIEYRWAEGHSDRLPELAADLVRKQVTVIAATSTPAAIAAKAVTNAIPVVFETASDPIRLGLVPSLSRPDGNVTGVTQINVEVAPKRLELMRELLPAARLLGLLVNQADPALAKAQLKDFQAAARTLGVELHVLNAGTDAELEKVLADFGQLRAGGLVISTDPFFTSRAEKLAALTARYAVPAVSKGREFAAAGGLLSYGSDTADSYRLAGVYTGRVLKGDKPADLPVQQPTKFEFVINLKTAEALGLTVPPALRARADEVFE
jgi:putative ABC transport system substrate-binding protein